MSYWTSDWWVFVDDGLSNGWIYKLRVSGNVMCKTYLKLNLEICSDCSQWILLSARTC